MKKCSVGGQAVMEGVMMKSPKGIAIAVRDNKGEIVSDYQPYRSKAKNGTFLGLPVIRGVVAFIESLSVGLSTLTKSANMYGEDLVTEPTKFETWLSRATGKSVEKIAVAIGIVLGVGLSVALFILLPTWISDLIFGKTEVAGIWRSLLAGVLRLSVFIIYILAVSRVKDIRRVFMYHGAEHKTIACYEAEDPLTVQNIMKHSRLHPRCGTNYIFLVMAVSILFFALVGWSDNKLILFGTRILLLPVVAGISYELLKFAAKSDNLLCRIVRAPGMGLQYLTTKEPSADMIEVALKSFELAMSSMGTEITPPTDTESADAAEIKG